VVTRELVQNGRQACLMRMEAPVKRPLQVFFVRGLDNDYRERVARGVSVYHVARLALVLVRGLVLGRVELVGGKRSAAVAVCVFLVRRSAELSSVAVAVAVRTFIAHVLLCP
jgi:hypothetical protein